MYIELNTNENRNYNLWESAKAVLTGKFISLNTCIRKGKDSITSVSTLS